MHISQTTVLHLSYVAAAAMSLALWQLDMYVLSAICLLIGGGVAVARPHIEDTRLVLDGTPVLLLFALLFISASSMVIAVDQVVAFFSSPASNSCVGAERIALFRVGG